jgi:hypothetical protein
VFININRIPSWNKLSIEYSPEINQQNDAGDLTILEIASVSQDGSSSVIPYYLFTTSGGCSSTKHGFLCKEGQTGSINFENFSSSNISLLLEGSNKGPSFTTNFSGNKLVIDTYSKEDDQFTQLLNYHFIWQMQSLFRKLELLIVFTSAWLIVAALLLLIVSFLKNIKSIVSIWRDNPGFYISLIILIILSIVNFSVFSDYQKTDLFKLQRNPGNTLIDLDNTSHSNINNIQLYLNLYNFFRDTDLYITQPVLQEFLIDEESLKDISRFKTIKTDIYNSTLDTSNLEKIKKSNNITIPPTGRIRFTYVLVLDTNEKSNVICTWNYENTLYFVHQNDDLVCLNQE